MTASTTTAAAQTATTASCSGKRNSPATSAAAESPISRNHTVRAKDRPARAATSRIATAAATTVKYPIIWIHGTKCDIATPSCTCGIITGPASLTTAAGESTTTTRRATAAGATSTSRRRGGSQAAFCRLSKGDCSPSSGCDPTCRGSTHST